MRLRSVLLALGIVAISGSKPVPNNDFDLVIRGGRVIDGAGNPSFTADIAIRGGKIVEVGVVESKGKEEYDARGKVVTPGFIDAHTHAEDIETIPLADNFLRMGVTTVVMGNCGGSALPLGAYFRKLEANGMSCNVASFVGHNTVRREGMGGVFNRPPTAEELSKMRKLVDGAMQDGALGLSTGLIYLPGTYSQTDEIIELAKVTKPYHGFYVSHMRSEGLAIFEAIDELLTIAKSAGIRGHLSHIKLSGNAMWGRANEILAKLEKVRAEGMDITQDQYAYTASSTTLSQLIPDRYLEKGAEEFKKYLADPAKREEISNAMKQNLANNKRTDYTYAVIASYRKDPSLNGKSIPEAAELKQGGRSVDQQIAMIFEIYINGSGSGVFHGINEDDLRLFMRHPNTAIASDSGVRAFGSGVPHPRGYGNNARVIQKYVQELGLLRLEDAIRKSTSLPAQAMGIVDRGLIREGMAADLLVFDPTQVRENTTYEKPHAYATGFNLVLVNGIKVVENDVHLKTKPGQILRAKNGAARGSKPSATQIFLGAWVGTFNDQTPLYDHELDLPHDHGDGC